MTEASVFIIESVKLAEEKNKYREGKIITDILRLSGIDSEYWPLRTKKELRAILKVYSKSRKRYLHISCHGNKKVIGLSLDTIDFVEFGRMLEPYLDRKRLFISACLATNKKLAKEIFPKSGCLSMIGPKEDPQFNDAAIIWAAFYYKMFKIDQQRMVRQDINNVLRELCSLFTIKMNYYGKKGIKPYYEYHSYG